MSYKGIDSRRFEYLLHRGVEPSIIKLFLKEKQRSLILSGAKADNLPSDYRKQVKFVAAIPEKAHEVIKEWFSAHLEKISGESAEQIICRLLMSECDVREISDDERKSDARSLLSLLLDDDTPQLVLDYLRTPLSKNEEDAPAPQPFPSYPSDADVQALADVVLGKVDAGHKTSNPVTMLVAALIQAKEGNKSGAQEIKQQLKGVLPHVVDEIERVIADIFERAAAEQATPRGIVIDEPLTRDSVDEIDPETVDVVGRCTKVLDTGPCFIKVIGLREGQDFVELSDEQTKQFFPESGDFMWFPGPGHQLGPKISELGIWRLQKKDVGETKKIKFRTESFVGAVYDVVSIPYDSAEPDKIRAWLKKSYVGQPAVKPIFQLKDGLLVKPVSETTDFDRLDYEQPFNAWETLNAVRWQGRFLMLDNLPPPEREWECPPIASAIKKVLKSHIEQETFPELTKRHIQQLCQKVEYEVETKIVSARLERVHKELDRLADQREVAREIVSELLNVSSVRKEVEEAKDKIVSDFKQSKADLAGELEKLRSQRDAVVKEIAQKKEDVKRQSAEVVKSVKRAFETAKAAGVDSLGQVALFQGFLSHNGVLTPSSSQGASPYASRLHVTEIAGVKGSLADRLAAMGLSRSAARQWELAIEISSRVGFVIAFCGSFASLVAREIAIAVTQRPVLSIDVPVGLVDGVELDNVLRRDGSVGVVLLRNANNSAMEAYASSLQDMAAHRIGLGFSDSSPSIVISLSNGISALPLSGSLVATSFLFDLDAIEPENVEEDAEDFAEDIRNRLILSKRGASTWLIGLRRLLDEVSKIDSIDRPAVLGLVKQGVVEPFFGSLQCSAGEPKQ